MYIYTFTNIHMHTFKRKIFANKIKDLSSSNLYVFQEKQDLEGRREDGNKRDVNVNFLL